MLTFYSHRLQLLPFRWNAVFHKAEYITKLGIKKGIYIRFGYWMLYIIFNWKLS